MSINAQKSSPALSLCPSSPNCVSSLSADAGHGVAPIVFSGPAQRAFAAFKNVIRAQPRAKVVAEGPDFVKAEFSSRVFKFVDDVEAVLDASKSIIHVRSASRTGYWDLGVNRARVERLRDEFHRATRK